MSSWTKPVRKHYRWVIVAAGGLLGCVAIGALFSLPVLLRPIALDTAWSTTGISTAMTIAFVAMAVGSMFWGALSDRIGPRRVVTAGTLLLCAGLWLSSRATSLPAFGSQAAISRSIFSMMLSIGNKLIGGDPLINVDERALGRLVDERTAASCTEALD